MTDADAPANLTGQWTGRYSFPRLRDPVTFVADIVELDGTFRGSIAETDMHGVDLTAIISGRRDGAAVRFTKTYLGAPRPYGTVQYEGALQDGNYEVTGHWRIPGDWSGLFLMVRPRRAKRTSKAREAERV